MTDLYLRFDDVADWRALDLERDPALIISVVGSILEPTQELDESGDQVMAAIPGWHVNIRCTDDRDLSALDPFIVTPGLPARVWA